MKRENALGKERNEEREMLHKQMELLAEKSKECTPLELTVLSVQMVSIYSALGVSF